MNVIKEGKEIKNVMRVTCDTCGAVLEIDANDINLSPATRLSTEKYYYRCPCCNTLNIISGDDMPDGMYVEFMRKLIES